MQIRQASRDAAAYWAMRLAGDGCGPADRAAFEAWCHERPENGEAYARTERALARVDRHATHPELIALGQAAAAATAPAANRRTRWIALAASAAIIGVSAVVYDRALIPSNPAVPAVASDVQIYETYTGERSSVRLADGSALMLNTGSRVEVDFSPARRDLRLVRGQAWFEVAKDPARPFVIEAGGYRVVALGTAFEVRLDSPARVQVILAEGRVGVQEIRSGAAGARGATGALLAELAPGQKLVAARGEALSITGADVGRDTSWREGRLVFRGDRLEDVVGEMNRYSVSQLVVDPELCDLPISGVFDTGRMPSFLLALERAHGIRALPLDGGRVRLTT